MLTVGLKRSGASGLHPILRKNAVKDEFDKAAHFPNRRSDTLQNEALRKTKHTNGDRLRVSGGQRQSTESV